MFEKYQKERNNAYMSVVMLTAWIIGVFLLATMIFTCIFYLSARPLWLLLVIVPDAVFITFFTVTKKTFNFTQKKSGKYYHNGGLFFESYAQFEEEEKRYDEEKPIA